MKLDLTAYIGKRVCVALSGGRDSMALLHYLHTNGKGIVLSALHCDHAMRASSPQDAQFVCEICKRWGVPLLSFRADRPLKSEEDARSFRRECYRLGAAAKKNWQGYDYLATAHHACDNAETVLMHLARGTGLNGLCGIAGESREDGYICIRPMIACYRSEIDAYTAENSVPFVEDETNFTDEYTRNRLRHNVLPALEEAIPRATEAIYRFSRLAQEDEELLSRLSDGYLTVGRYAYKIAPCAEKALFKRAVLHVLRAEGKKDYTATHLEQLFELQGAPTGKRFSFLGLTVFQERSGLAICQTSALSPIASPLPFTRTLNGYGGEPFTVGENGEGKALYFDPSAIPSEAVVRFAERGDRFCKFGGAEKNLGDFFTDAKIPVRLRGRIPLVAVGKEVLIVGGVEISERVKCSGGQRLGLFCTDYRKE